MHGSVAHSLGKGEGNAQVSVIANPSFGYYNDAVRIVVGLALLCALVGACTPSSPAPPPAAHGWTMVVHARTGQTPGPVTLGGRWAFVPNMSEGTVSELDRSTGHLIATIKIADPRALRDQGCAPDSVHAFYSGSWGWRMCDTPYAMAWDGSSSSLWALDNGNRALWRVDPAKHEVVERIGLPGTGWSIAFSTGKAYVSGFADNHALYVADLKTHAVTTISNLDNGPATLTADASGVWVACVRGSAGHLDHIDPTTNEVTGRYPIEWWSEAITADKGALYVRGTFGGDISRVDPATGAVTWTQGGPGFIGRQGIDQLGVADNGIWMSGPVTARVDLGTGETVDKIMVPSSSVAAGNGEVWMIMLDGSVAKFQLK